MTVQGRTISAGGATPIHTLSPPGVIAALHPQVATDAEGESVVTWDADARPTQARTLGSTGSPGPVLTLSAGRSETLQNQRISMNSQGDATVVWSAFHPRSSSQIQATQGP